MTTGHSPRFSSQAGLASIRAGLGITINRQVPAERKASQGDSTDAPQNDTQPGSPRFSSQAGLATIRGGLGITINGEA